LHKYKITLEYDGTGYSGWQTQKNARTIQATVLTAAREVFGTVADLQGAGRTDAGVHALGQVAHIETEKRLPPAQILFGLNDRLPASVNVLHVEAASPRFHARHHARQRIYLYQISRRRTAFGKRYVWWIKDDLDTAAMKEACALFVGMHDFASFADKRFDKDASTKVKVDAVELIDVDDLCVIRVAGSHFLWKMVRRMAGVLVDVGRGKLDGRAIAKMLQHFSAEPARLTAPASGLFLEQVLYEGDRPQPVNLPRSYPSL